jgi:hypothetical protein
LCWLAGGFGNARPATGTWCALCREQGAKVFATDIEPHDGLDEVFDFLSPGQPKGLERYDGIRRGAKAIGRRSLLLKPVCGASRATAVSWHFCCPPISTAQSPGFICFTIRISRHALS